MLPLRVLAAATMAAGILSESTKNPQDLFLTRFHIVGGSVMRVLVVVAFPALTRQVSAGKTIVFSMRYGAAIGTLALSAPSPQSCHLIKTGGCVL